ncbi:MAG: guanylate kinase [Chloroflexi bacterium]|nr:guanylate kinase [Chloroflexota bacterium]MDK1045046.1 guanylate kinase [Anaerolineales bacterium]MCH8094006.1 guanylate kinase [Chloroflexota bacterium]MCH8875424.1 guanylate kinase [Chloroflexota bacterium]MCI0805334.1 guanylate kinase [Chloroflexota bacterium]
MGLYSAAAAVIEQPAEPLLVVISGPSGVGKDTVLDRMKQRGLPFHFVVTATTRPRRPGEVEGEDYFFVGEQEFLDMIEKGELIEHALVYNDHKGVPRQQIRAAMESGQDVVMRVDVQGAKTIQSLAPEALLIFLTARDEDELSRRLRKRRTESEADLKLRLEAAKEELGYLDIFDYVVLNADSTVETAVDTILAIIEAEHHRINPRRVNL